MTTRDGSQGSATSPTALPFTDPALYALQYIPYTKGYQTAIRKRIHGGTRKTAW